MQEWSFYSLGTASCSDAKVTKSLRDCEATNAYGSKAEGYTCYSDWHQSVPITFLGEGISNFPVG